MTPTLRPLQVDLYDRVRAARAAGARIIVVQAATGFGKNTLGAYFGARCDEQLKRALFLVHRRRLVDQISGRLNQFEVRHAVLMRGERYDAFARINVASRDTMMSRCFDNQWLPLPPADLLVIDEGHHAALPGSEYRQICDRYPNATIILLTATPVGPDGQGMGPWAQALVCSAPTSELVREGYLVPVRIYRPESRMRRGRPVRGVAGDLVRSWKQYAEGRPTLLFCSRVKHSTDAVAAFRAAGVRAEHMDAKTPDETRDRIFEDVAAGRIDVVSNVGIVGEGVDVPELGCVQWFCEVNSRTKWLQGNGRVMRPAPGKKDGIIIDHPGAVFRHGWPDEDTPWSLVGNADEDFAAKHKDGKTEKTHWCRACEEAYKGQLACPNCGRMPAKPPRTIFDPPPTRSRNELLVEGDRGEVRPDGREERVRIWLRCLGMAGTTNGTFAKARVLYHKKYGEWPPRDFPCQHENIKAKVAEVYPRFDRRKRREPANQAEE
jgi:superfamily II DNA or RNA helicase